MKHLVNWLLYVIAVFVAAYLLPGVSIGSIFAALVVALILGVLNTFGGFDTADYGGNIGTLHICD